MKPKQVSITCVETGEVEHFDVLRESNLEKLGWVLALGVNGKFTRICAAPPNETVGGRVDELEKIRYHW